MKIIPEITQLPLVLLTGACLALWPPDLRAQDHVLRPATPREAGMSDSVLLAARTLFADAVASGKIVGGVLLISRHGKVALHEAFGFRDFRARQLTDLATLFRMSSNTEPLTAAATAILVERGQLRFTDSVGAYVPSWDNAKSGAITVHQLLSHTSGIAGDGMFNPSFISWPLRASPSLKRETDRIGRAGPKNPPGTAYFHASAGYDALGGLIETISGRSLADFLRTEVFEKSGMTDTYVHETAAALGDHIRRLGPTYMTSGHLRWTESWRPGNPPDVPFVRGSGGLVTTAWDYAVFMQALLNGGVYNGARLLKPEAVRTMLSPQTPPGAQRYGYGWELGDDGVFFRSGSTGTFAWGDPARGVIVVAMAQTSSAVELRPALMRIVNRAVDLAEAGR